MTTVIEYPASGATYCHDEYGVYEYGVYERGSVLEGEEKRTFLASFPTLEEAKAAYPHASWHGGDSGYVEREVSRLEPDWFDPMNAGETWNDDY